MQKTSMVVGMSGGMVPSADGVLQIQVPAGALTGNVMMTVAATASPGAGAVGTVYEIGPTGTQFAMPVKLTFNYASVNLGGTAESSLRVATFAAANWQNLPAAQVNPQAKTVSGTTTHLSPYTIVAESTGSACAAVENLSSCHGSTSGGSGAGTGPAGGSGSSDPGASDGGAATCPAADTCVTATNICGGYPGATAQGCADQANGYTASCCFPPGAAICFAAGSSSTGCHQDCSADGTCTNDCPPPPTCAGATDACAGYPGATLQNCVDGSGGFTGSCCFAPGAPVCETVSIGARCSNGATTTGGSTICDPPPQCADGDPCATQAGSTMQTCTDTATGYTATCCFATGTLPPTGGSPSSGGSTGIDTDASAGGNGADGGATLPPSDAGGGQPPPPDDASAPPPPPGDAGAPPPPSKDGGGQTLPPDDAGGGQPPPPDDASAPPPPPGDAGAPSPPPPSDGGAGGKTCQVMSKPSPGGGSPCGVTEICPDGSNYQVQCDSTSGECTCSAKGMPTSTTFTASCTSLDPNAALSMCGFPAGTL